MDIYALMVHRKLEPGSRHNLYATVNLTTQTDMTLEEGVYALKTVLRWNGIELVPVGEDKLKAVPVRRN